MGFALESTCYGTPENGAIENAIQLPTKGSNYQAYSKQAIVLGRTYVHSNVYALLVDSYSTLESVLPETVFVYGESGAKHGGPFPPHKTHQNGLSVDFMVPVRIQMERSVYLPTNMSNKFGYGIEFDHTGHWQSFSIDFDAIVAHLLNLHSLAEKHGLKIKRVIFDPDLQKYLWQAKDGDKLHNKLHFSTKSSWVRHDEHYHVDFTGLCEPLRVYQ